METCVRGFSFMSESKADLQFIEGGELERAWRSTRRERMKQREQRIWDNFVKEQDAVKGVCNDDPYQFLDPLPESCMKEILENDQPKVKEVDIAPEEPREPRTNVSKEPSQHGTGDNASGDDGQHTCVVSFAKDMERVDSDVFYIFDDDQSGGEDENLNGCSSPETVREKPPQSARGAESPRPAEPARASADQSPERDDLKQSSSKSSENVASVIESSIYCARVKELRAKINEELLALMSSLDRRDILLSSEAEDIARMVKRSAEFCNRFNRIHMYQLQRQIHDIKRNNSQTLPFAKHTQFQSQMTRIVTLHQNLLQSFMVFHKSLSATCCVRESAGALGSLLAAVRDSTHMCLNLPPPKEFTACLDLYKDALLTTCDKVDEFVTEYAIRCEEFLNRFETMNSVSSKKTKKEPKEKKRTWNVKNPVKSGTDSQLSMYSMDTRLNFHVKSSTSSNNQTRNSSKMRIGASPSINLKKGVAEKNPEAPKSTRRSRRPLMRDPHAGRPRVKPARETDIQTMVQAVGTCASSHVSYDDSPRTSGVRAARRAPPLRVPPRHTPAARLSPASHGNTPVQGSPRVPPVNSLNLASPRTLNLPAKKSQTSPRTTKPMIVTPRTRNPSPPKSKRKSLSPRPTEASKESLSFHKHDQETEEPEVMPVVTIKCAMKKNLVPETRELPDDTKKATTDASQLKVVYKNGECSKTEVQQTGQPERERIQMADSLPDRYEVTRLLKQLCSGDGSGRTERITGTKNAQLVYVSGNSPRQPSTPQLLKILEETIKKKVPKTLFTSPASARGDRHRLQFNISEKTADAQFQYRTKFVQHMLTSAMYANSAVGKPWEMIGNVSEHLIDEVLLNCVSKMELREIIQELYKKETTCP